MLVLNLHAKLGFDKDQLDAVTVVLGTPFLVAVPLKVSEEKWGGL